MQHASCYISPPRREVCVPKRGHGKRSRRKNDGFRAIHILCAPFIEHTGYATPAITCMRIYHNHVPITSHIGPICQIHRARARSPRTCAVIYYNTACICTPGMYTARVRGLENNNRIHIHTLNMPSHTSIFPNHSPIQSQIGFPVKYTAHMRGRVMYFCLSVCAHDYIPSVRADTSLICAACSVPCTGYHLYCDHFNYLRARVLSPA
jgi:hypothetical protein